jgi:flagellar basal-body rod protein FlgF
MDPITITAASGLRARMEALDLLANNMANLSSPGYKADREAYQTYRSEEAAQAAALGGGRPQPLSPVVEGQWTDLSQGSLTMTGNRLDVAFSGSGFLVAAGPDGPLLSRGGTLQISKDGRLLTPEGYELQTRDPDRKLRADPLLPLQIDPDGTVRQNELPLGQLKVVGPPSPDALAKRQGLYFALDARSLQALPAAQGELRQGALESANLGPSEAAVRLVNVLRQFETLQKALQLGGEMNRKAVDEIARVHS